MTVSRKTLFGTSLKRLDDQRILRGDGQYIADLKLRGMAQAAVLRSPHPHARIVSIDAASARKDPRALAVLTGADLDPVPRFPNFDAEPTGKPFFMPAIATERVLYVGEPVAIVVAHDRYEAEDLLPLIEVDYEVLEPVLDPEASLEPDAPILHEGTNVADVVHYAQGDPSAIDRAPHRIRRRFTINRHVAAPIETRGAIADWDRGREVLTLWSSTQGPHSLKAIICAILGLSEYAMRVIVPDVGGAFGPKNQLYPEELLLCILARKLARPVQWIEDRWENLVSMNQGREQIHDAEIGYDDDGIIVGIRDHIVTGTGAYLTFFSYTEGFQALGLLRGPYRIPNFEGTNTVVMTNKTSLGPFRAVGHPQAAQVMERLVDDVAKERGLDPTEVRFQNMLTPEELPCEREVEDVFCGPLIYDSGDYPAALEKALDMIGYDEFRSEQAKLRADDRYLGIGIACYVQLTSMGPFETGIVRVAPSGKVLLLTGTTGSGQGHETTLAQIAADALDIPPEDVKVVCGDTDIIATGMGAYGSRSAAVAGSAVRRASNAVREKALITAAELLEAAPDDLKLEDGRVFVIGSPDRGATLGEIATRLAPGQLLPLGIESHGLEATDHFVPPGNACSYGTVISTVEVDVETGIVRPLRMVMVHDAGRLINPLIVEGQLHGGLGLGLGGALLEEVVYDESGQPLTTNFMDYVIPGAENMPEIELAHIETPSPHNADGIKGVGESGAIGPPGAIANAVSDALDPFGIVFTEVPITPTRVFEALVESGVISTQAPAPIGDREERDEGVI